ncbi:MAG: maleylpyruvate isomerase family mycothiol-dependent enzyme [Candidatus Dormibacteria bacterium]
MPKPIDQREREELSALLVELGPDAPTLCAGWSAFDLAAHLTLREHFHRWGDARMAAAKRQGFPAVVARVERGAPFFPWRIPKLRNLLNGTEFFIHHEDLRRANGLTRRADRADLDRMSWRMLGFLGRRLSHAVGPFGLELRTPSGESRRFGSSPAVVITGQPTELLLYASGRRSAAEVVIGGPSVAVAALEHAHVRL